MVRHSAPSAPHHRTDEYALGTARRYGDLEKLPGIFIPAPFPDRRQCIGLSTIKIKVMKHPCYHTFLKFTAFVVPFYFVYYGPLYEKPKDPQIKTLRWYMMLGFAAYLILTLIILFT
jgi:hypothetical protein